MIREGCVHMLASWVPAHNWEVTVQLQSVHGGPRLGGTGWCHQAQCLVSFLVHDWTRYPQIRDILTLTTEGFSNFSKWRLTDRFQHPPVFVKRVEDKRILLCITWGRKTSFFVEISFRVLQKLPWTPNYIDIDWLHLIERSSFFRRHLLDTRGISPRHTLHTQCSSSKE